MNRPYLSKSIDQLEQVLEVSMGDQAVLQLLADELKFRKTARAKELESEVTYLLAEFDHSRLPPSGNGPEALSPAPSPVPAPPPAPPAPPTPDALDTQHASPTGRTGAFRNRPTDILDAWTALEVLTPHHYERPVKLANGVAANLVSIENGRLPWDAGPARSRPHQRIYFHIVLATIDAKAAMDGLVGRFKDTRIERPRVAGDIALASVLVDKEGRLAGDAPVTLSAFGWGLPIALRGSLKGLGRWAEEESRLSVALKRQLVRETEDEQATLVTWDRLQEAFAWLISTLGLPPEHIKGPRFAIAAYMPFRMSSPPDALMLNSYFLRDLAKAKALARDDKLPSALALFLGARKPNASKDVLHDTAALEASLAPANAPLGRWPTPSGQSLALLQQSAVNLAASLHGRNGVVGVNGPPGTGKSTLLRDVVADLMTRRAQAMCAFADPAAAFTVKWSRRSRGETTEIHGVNASLRGFEMIVASSNNKAVENVSAELPTLAAIPEGSSLRYFAPLAQELLDRDAWGLVAAVLGNATNRSKFRKAFWTESPRSFKRYLEHVSGVAAADVGEGGLAQACNAPSGAAEALARWRAARDRFGTVTRQSSSRLAQLEQLRTSLSELPALQHREVQAEAALVAAQSDEEESDATLRTRVGEAQVAAGLTEEAERALFAHERAKPAWYGVKRLVGAASAKEWDARHAPLVQARVQAQQAKDAAESEQAHADRLARMANKHACVTADNLERARTAREAVELRCRTIRVGHGALVVDEAFHAQPHREKQQAVAWLDTELQEVRMRVFEAAVDVHRAFIDAAARPLLHNLNALMGGNYSLPPDRHQVLGDAWASLFLIVPVVSTAFASVERMLSSVGPETFGWVLIDEAGQATPQSAVGALMRCQRAVVVGDPQQVEPVVTLPETLTGALMREFDVDPDRFSAPSATAQTLADDASEHTATFTTSLGSRTVGAPLLVHRRCASPMFDISNAIAYNQLMVQAKRPARSAIRDVLGASRWIDVIGPGNEKYSPSEGDAVLALLHRLREAAVAPDLYIVTPFVAVQDGMRQLVQRSGVLTGWVPSPVDWIKERIGTVHTVQGREAEAVVFVLGAPEPGQQGARAWAGSRPNLLNVAVTRAKEVLYVVGNRSLWAGAGHFSALVDALP